MKLGTAFIGVLFYGTVLAPLYTVLFLRNFKKGLPDFSESPIKFDTRTSKMLRISSVAGIRQMPAKAIKQGLPSKLEVPVIIAFYALISLLSQDYSIILATRPEPTVLPPSRALGNEIWMFFLVFATYYSSYYLIWHYIFTVLKNFRAKIEPAAKYRFSPYPSLLHGASTMYK